MGTAARSYYMTLDAIDTAAAGSSSSLQTFQTKVSEEACGLFILLCDIARIRGKTCVYHRNHLNLVADLIPFFHNRGIKK